MIEGLLGFWGPREASFGGGKSVKLAGDVAITSNEFPVEVSETQEVQ